MSNAMIQSYFDSVPSELLDIIVGELDISAISRLLCTNKYFYNADIAYHIYLMYPEKNKEKLEWHRNLSNSNTMKYMHINKLAHYLNICKYYYMHNNFLVAHHTIHGFCTDLPINILLSGDTICVFPFIAHRININSVEIIDYGTIKQIKFIYEYKNNIWLIQSTRSFNINGESEVIYGRLSLYAENNIQVAHTTTSYFNIDQIKYFVSFYTLSPEQ